MRKTRSKTKAQANAQSRVASRAASPRRKLVPLDSAQLEALAVSYVARYATSCAKLSRYLARKIRARGWTSEPAQKKENCNETGYSKHKQANPNDYSNHSAQIEQNAQIEQSAQIEQVVKRMVQSGFINDEQYAASRVRSMTQRGLGARRVQMQLEMAGIAQVDAQPALTQAHEQALASAVVFARRRRLGPFARHLTEKTEDALPIDEQRITRNTISNKKHQERHIAAFVRAGHSATLARRILSLEPGDEDALVLLDEEKNR